MGQNTSPELPSEIAQLLDLAALDEQDIGRTGNRLIRGRTRDGRGIYLKVGNGAVTGELMEEAERLQWIDGRLPAPEVLAAVEQDGWAFLVISEVAGTPAHELGGANAVRALAAAMRAVHELPVDGNPFTGMVDRELAQAERRVAEGSIDVEGFIGDVGEEPVAVLRSLQTGPPQDELVFTHGDLCLPNLLIDDGAPSGIVDWALAGVADPHRDFMSAELTIRRNVGEEAIASFYDAYGRTDVDTDRVKYFWMLDQFTIFYHEPTLAS